MQNLKKKHLTSNQDREKLDTFITYMNLWSFHQGYSLNHTALTKIGLSQAQWLSYGEPEKTLYP